MSVAKARPPRRLAPYRGRRLWVFHVVATQSSLFNSRTVFEGEVIAHTANEAANLIRDEIAPKVWAPTEIETRGPRGGAVARFIGHESLIWAKMRLRRGDGAQLPLFGGRP